MTAPRVPALACLLALVGCTVGDGGDTTLSGGASASQGSDGSGGTTASTGDADDTSDDDGSAEHGPTQGSSAADDATTDAGASTDDDGSSGASETSGSAGDESSSSDGGNGLEDGVLDVTIIAHDDCTITTMPAAISVPEGTEFTVNWISSAASEVPVDVAKIDPFNAVPIILGMEPGTSYHDEVRAWCGALFTGTFEFEITSCYDPHVIPVDCAG